MRRILFVTNFCCILCLFLTISGCSVLPRSECEISEADAKRILGVSSPLPIDKTDPSFGYTLEDSNVRACGYVIKEVKDIRVTSLYWVETKSENNQKSQELFNDRFKNNPPDSSDVLNSSVENLSGIGEEANLLREQETDRKRVRLAVRKGKNVFVLMATKEPSSEIPVEEIKALAKRIADRTFD